MDKFEFAGRKLKRIKKYKFWKDDNHAIELTDNHIIDQKINYIHENPVRAMIVSEAEHYLFSSAIDHSGSKGYVNISEIWVTNSFFITSSSKTRTRDGVKDGLENGTK